MTEQEILAAVQDIFRDNFDDDTLEITRATCADDIEDCNSHPVLQPTGEQCSPLQAGAHLKKYFRRPVPPFFRSFTAHEEDV